MNPNRIPLRALHSPLHFYLWLRKHHGYSPRSACNYTLMNFAKSSAEYIERATMVMRFLHQQKEEIQ